MHRMLTQHLLRRIARLCPWWCALLVLLSGVQPFLSVHFDDDGLVPQQQLNVRAFGETAQFQTDADSKTPMALEVTLFAPAAASIDSPLLILSGLAAFMCLVMRLAPLTVWLGRRVSPLPGRPAFEVPAANGAPPPTALWRSRPPETAPPR